MASANIFQQYLQQPRSVLDYQAQYEEADARKANLQARTQQNALQALALRQQTDQFGQAQTERNALQRIAGGWSASTPVDERIASLRNSGMPGLMSQADALEKSSLDRRDKESEISGRQATEQGTRFKTSDEQRKAAIAQVAAVGDPAAAAQLIQQFAQSGEIPAQVAPALASLIQSDPKWQLKLIMGISDPAKMLELLKPHLQTVNAGNAQVQQAVDPMTGKVTETGRTQIMQSPDNAATNQRVASEGALNRSQQKFISDRADTRARETLSQGKAPSGYRANPDGTLSFIPGGPADPANKALGEPTEGERKAATLLTRLRGSQAQLTQALTDAPGAAKPGVIASSVRRVAGDDAANVITGQERQRVEAAQLDLLDAALTLGTGAAYTTEQLKGYSRSYFPQIGDDSKTIADKKERLKTVIKAAEVAAGRAEKLTPKPASPNPKPKPGKGTDLGDGFTVVN